MPIIYYYMHKCITLTHGINFLKYLQHQIAIYLMLAMYKNTTPKDKIGAERKLLFC